MLDEATPWQTPAGAQDGAERGETHQTHQTHRPDVRQIQLIRGARAQTLTEALALLRDRGELFERGGELVRVTYNGVEPVNDDWLLSYLDSHAAFIGFRKRGDFILEEPRDAPAWLGRRINAHKGEWGLRTLRAVIGAPSMRADGTLIVEPGYDPLSGLFLLPSTDRPAVPETPRLVDLKAAAERLWL